MNLVGLALLSGVAAVSRDSRESHQLRKAIAVKKADASVSNPFTRQVQEGNPWVPKNKHRYHRKSMDAIKKFRAEICARMKKENGVEFGSFDACHKFMKKACNPGGDKAMDGDRKEHPSREGYCQEYFPAAEKKAKEEADKSEKEEEEAEAAAAAKGAAPAPMPSPGPGPAVAGIMPAPAPAAAGKAPAAAAKAPAAAAPGSAPGAGAGGPVPAPGPMGAPGPAPVPGPFTPGKTKGQPWGPIADDEKWYYAKNGKDPMRLHMSEDLLLPTQGYWGKLVGHEDMETSTGDWGKEFGPRAGHGTIVEACKDHPENEWCIKQGYAPKIHYQKWRRSSSITVFASPVPMVLALIAMAIQ